MEKNQELEEKKFMCSKILSVLYSALSHSDLSVVFVLTFSYLLFVRKLLQKMVEVPLILFDYFVRRNFVRVRHLLLSKAQKIRVRLV